MKKHPIDDLVTQPTNLFSIFMHITAFNAQSLAKKSLVDLNFVMF